MQTWLMCVVVWRAAGAAHDLTRERDGVYERGQNHRKHSTQTQLFALKVTHRNYIISIRKQIF